jgi:hypothetical protein
MNGGNRTGGLVEELSSEGMNELACCEASTDLKVRMSTQAIYTG